MVPARARAVPTSLHTRSGARSRERFILARRLRKAAAWFARETDSRPSQGFEFVRAHQAEHRVATMGRVLAVSPSGYYAWHHRGPTGPGAGRRGAPRADPRHPHALPWDLWPASASTGVLASAMEAVSSTTQLARRWLRWSLGTSSVPAARTARASAAGTAGRSRVLRKFAGLEALRAIVRTRGPSADLMADEVGNRRRSTTSSSWSRRTRSAGDPRAPGADTGRIPSWTS